MIDDVAACGGGFFLAELFTTKAGAAILGIAALAGVAIAGHYAYDSMMYSGDLDKLRGDFVKAAVETCGNDDADRMRRIHLSVSNELERYKGTIAWMPNKSAAEQLETARSFNSMVLYPVTFGQKLYAFDEGVTGVLYNENEERPVFAYRSLERAQFGGVLKALEQNGLPEGNAVVRWNAFDRQYEVVEIPAGARSVTIGERSYDKVEIGANPCHMDEGLRGIGKQFLRDLIPGGR